MPTNRQDFQLLIIQLKSDMILSGNTTIGIPIVLMIPRRVRGSIQERQLGWRQFPWILPAIRRTLFWILVVHDRLDQEKQSGGSRNIRRIMGLQQNSVLALSVLCLPTLEQKLVWESCIINFPTKPPCSTSVDVLQTGNVPIQNFLPQMQNFGITIELDPKGAKITCPAFGLNHSPVEYSTMGHIVLDLTSLAYQPKLREQLARVSSSCPRIG